jgi:hypothetical protein
LSIPGISIPPSLPTLALPSLPSIDLICPSDAVQEKL